MKSEVCGYDREACDVETGHKITVVYGVEAGCVDVGRDDDGEVRSFVTKSDFRLLQSESSSSTPEVQNPIPSNDSFMTIVQQGRELAHRLVMTSPRRKMMFAAGVGFVVVVTVVALISPAGLPKSNGAPDTTMSHSAGNSANQVQPELSDPQNASIEMALTGAIAGLGNMEGVSRSAVHASIASRAGDIVLIDLSVTKANGLTAFATVLLQKVGSQWRMRQIVDERN